ncbi:MAG: 3-dehydroquinate synthase [Candidatus Latescibacterota bacterium]
MRVISVALDERAYGVHVGHGILDQLGPRCRELGLSGRPAVVTDERVAPRYLAPVVESLSRAGYEPLTVRLAGGESAKSLSTAEAICGQLIAGELDRRGWIVALGGGVVGDLAGFVAATFLRGIPFVQVPTTILAQVDASLGGKTGVNHPLGKNLIGAFHQPRLVWIDTGVLCTLPPRERVGGLAEVIKHAVIRDAGLFAFLEDHLEVVLSLELDAHQVDWLIARNVEIKAEVVAADEREQGLRALLNYGHTLGHAIEAAGAYQRFRHGEAVALGMVAAGHIAREQGLWSPAEGQRQEALLRRLGLPGGVAELAPEAILQHARADKKRAAGVLRFVLPRRIGHAEVFADVPEAVVRGAIRHVQGNW